MTSKPLIELAAESSRTTHTHPWAIQGAALQAAAVATAVRNQAPQNPRSFLASLAAVLDHFEVRGQDTLPYRKALQIISQGLVARTPPARVSETIGIGIKAHEAVPMAIYCFLANSESFENALESAVFLGGDTDTIACMAGAISGAYLGASQIPERWLSRVREKVYSPARLVKLADDLVEKGLQKQFKR